MGSRKKRWQRESSTIGPPRCRSVSGDFPPPDGIDWDRCVQGIRRGEGLRSLRIEAKSRSRRDRGHLKSSPSEDPETRSASRNSPTRLGGVPRRKRVLHPQIVGGFRAAKIGVHRSPPTDLSLVRNPSWFDVTPRGQAERSLRTRSGSWTPHGARRPASRQGTPPKPYSAHTGSRLVTPRSTSSRYWHRPMRQNSCRAGSPSAWEMSRS